MIALGSDHGGLALKRHVMDYLDQHQLAYKDYGCYTSDSCDYPDFGRAAAQAVASGECDRGIVICTTGIGISIAANKVKGIRCALCSEPLSAEMTRRHNDANMLAMGAGLVGRNMAQRVVDRLLEQGCSGTQLHQLVEEYLALGLAPEKLIGFSALNEGELSARFFGLLKGGKP